jgi:hypothetical protein
LGGSWYESAKVYPNKSKALFEGRQFIIRNIVCWEMTQVLKELYVSESLSLEEYRTLVRNLQADQAMSLH